MTVFIEKSPSSNETPSAVIAGYPSQQIFRRLKRIDSFATKALRCLLRPAMTALAVFALTSHATAAEPLLPDLFAWESEQLNYMHGGFFDRNTIPNKVLYRFTGALPNQGAGPLEVREVTHPNGTQDVYQRIYDDEGGIAESLIGSFPDANPTFGHLWLEGIAQYNLRTMTAGGGVGPIVASMDKTSMALVDGAEYNTSLPGAPATPVYDDASDPILGVSVGWADLYSSFLPGQWIEVTGLSGGDYWLEVVADPYNRIEESDELNNTTRIMVSLQIPQPMIMPGDYNIDDKIDAADYVIWRKTFGQEVNPGTAADGDGNGAIEPDDYVVWAAHFAQTAGSGAAIASSSNATVPEPASVSLLVVGAFAICRGRRTASRVPTTH